MAGHIGKHLCLLVLVLAVCSGCSVVTVNNGKGKPEDTYGKLENWRNRADQADRTSAKYAVVAKAVNVWINTKAGAAEAAGKTMSTQVDITIPKDLETQANSVLPPTPPAAMGGAALLEPILELILKQYQDSRIEEGVAASVHLKQYLWPDPAPARP